MGFVSVVDERAGVECVFFSDAWALSERVLTAGVPILVRGKLEKSHREGEETCKIIAESAELLSDVRERRTRAVHLLLEQAELMPRLSDLSELLTQTPGTTPVHLHLRMPNLAWVSLQLGSQVVAKLEQLCVVIPIPGPLRNHPLGGSFHHSEQSELVRYHGGRPP